MTIVRSISDANTANTISDDQRKAFVALFPQYAELSSGEQDKLIQKVLNNANDLNEDSKEFAEKVEKNIFESTKNNKDMEEQLTKKEEEKSEKIQDLYTKLDEQEEEITGLKKERKNLRSNLTRSKGQYKKDLTSATSIEFGPLTVRRLILLKRQQTKLQHFMKNDPKAGMRYAYYNGMFGVRHLKRALHKKGRIKENPEKVKKKFEAYIKDLKEQAKTPKEQVIIKALAQQAKEVNNKYVDVYNEQEGPKKFNS